MILSRNGVRAGRAGPPLMLVAAGCAGLLLAGCGSSATAPAAPTMAPAATGHGAAGAIRVAGAYIPQQASPDVAAAYLDITNTGDTTDALTTVTSPAAPTVSMHDDITTGDGEAMVPLATLAVPAHSSARFTVGHRHLMLMNPPHLLRQGQTVMLSLHFARAGELTMAVPVVGFTAPATARASA